MIQIQPFSVSKSLPEMEALTRLHWEETEWDVCGEGPKPSAEMYKAMEDAGMLVAYAAVEREVIVGYVTVMVHRHIHYDFLFGAHDTLFLRNDLRDGTTGLKLKHRAEKEAQARGALFVAWHCKPGSPFEKMLQAERLPPAETIYIKRF